MIQRVDHLRSLREQHLRYLEQVLRATYLELCRTVLIGFVRDSWMVGSAFEKYRPEIVYLAAAHKHVPLMVTSPCKAIKNNVIGTPIKRPMSH